MAQNLGQLTDMWMVNPTMFDPSQASNQFSNFNNAALPYPPTYNGAPVNAATGQPIQSFLNWQQANPGGMSLNSTPAQPQAAPAAPATAGHPSLGGGMNYQGAGGQPGNYMSPQFSPAMQSFMGGGPMLYGNQQPAQAAPAGPAGPQASGPPNNWQAAINALANPGRVQTMGANVPLMTGSQPAGGVNQAFLQQAGAGQGMNANFLSALRAIQGRPQ
jgi:hypothetical protein